MGKSEGSEGVNNAGLWGKTQHGDQQEPSGGRKLNTLKEKERRPVMPQVNA